MMQKECNVYNISPKQHNICYAAEQHGRIQNKTKRGELRQLDAKLTTKSSINSKSSTISTPRVTHTSL